MNHVTYWMQQPLIIIVMFSLRETRLHKCDINHTSRCNNIFTLVLISPWDKPSGNREHNRHVQTSLNASLYHQSQLSHLTPTDVFRDWRESLHQGGCDRWKPARSSHAKCRSLPRKFPGNWMTLVRWQNVTITAIHMPNGRHAWTFY
jgi:hypothetical protein